MCLVCAVVGSLISYPSSLAHPSPTVIPTTNESAYGPKTFTRRLTGELGLLSRGVHSRTIVASTDSKLAMLDRNSLDEIEETDKALLCCLQHLALRTAAVRSHELMLFNAGSLGP